MMLAGQGPIKNGWAIAYKTLPQGVMATKMTTAQNTCTKRSCFTAFGGIQQYQAIMAAAEAMWVLINAVTAKGVGL